MLLLLRFYVFFQIFFAVIRTFSRTMSVTLRYRRNEGWNTSKIIYDCLACIDLLLSAVQTPTSRMYSKSEHPKFWLE